jgi:sulfate adenylyltransferase
MRKRLIALERTRLPRRRQGFTVFFTGLPGAGKSTLANALLLKLLEMGEQSVMLLDGDVVRKQISADLGFSKEDRDLNIRRIGHIACQIAQNGGIALCASIAPYDATRREVRALIEGTGSGFLLIYVETPLAVCEQRDRKGLYAKARAGSISHFTGISDPYEAPSDADLVIDATNITPESAARQIIDRMQLFAPTTAATRDEPRPTTANRNRSISPRSV